MATFEEVLQNLSLPLSGSELTAAIDDRITGGKIAAAIGIDLDQIASLDDVYDEFNKAAKPDDIPDVSGFLTSSDLQGYATQSQLSDLVTQSELTSAISGVSVDPEIAKESVVIAFGQTAPNPPTDAPDQDTLRTYYAEISNIVSTVYSVWLFEHEEGKTGKWQRLFPAESDLLAVNSSFSPNGLYPAARRGEMILFGSVNNGVMNTLGVKVFMAVNANSSSWIQIN